MTAPTCTWCGKPILPGQPSLARLRDPFGKSDVMDAFHSECSPTRLVEIPNTERPPRRTDQ